MLSSLTKRRAALTAGLVVSVCLWLALSSSLFPALSDDPPQNLQVIQSDDPRVIREEQWTTQTAAGASGGSYLYNTAVNPDRPDPALLLQFSGTYLEVVYVSGPNLGILAIEVDGTVLRTIITANDRTEYNQRTTINYLSDELHTLRVYAQSGGTVGVDAFVVNLSPPTSTPSEGNRTQRAPYAYYDCDPNAATEVITRSYFGNTGGNATSWNPVISGDGNHIVFLTNATNLLAGGSSIPKVFVYNRLTCDTQVASVSSNGTYANSFSSFPSISDNGRFVAFISAATNLASGDLNNSQDIFVRDMQTGTTTWVSQSYNYSQTGGGGGRNVLISGNGRYVIYTSDASDLIPNDTNGRIDVFQYDQETGQTSRINLAPNGSQAQGNSYLDDVSSDGRFILFHSYADVTFRYSSTVQLFLYDRQTGLITCESVSTDGVPGNQDYESAIRASVSADGGYVVFSSISTNLVPNDTNDFPDVFVRDRTSNHTIRITGVNSVQPNAFVGSPNISDDGRTVVFESSATNLIDGYTTTGSDLYLYDIATGQISNAMFGLHGEIPNGSPFIRERLPGISSNGQIIVAEHYATNLVPNLWEIFLFNREAIYTGYLTVIPRSTSELQVYWSVGSEQNLTHVMIERSLDRTNWQVIQTRSIDPVMNFIDSGLQEGIQYHYRMRAYRSTDNRYSGYTAISSAFTYGTRPTATATNTYTFTPTRTSTFTPTPTRSRTPTFTFTSSNTPTSTVEGACSQVGFEFVRFEPNSIVVFRIHNTSGAFMVVRDFLFHWRILPGFENNINPPYQIYPMQMRIGSSTFEDSILAWYAAYWGDPESPTEGWNTSNFFQPAIPPAGPNDPPFYWFVDFQLSHDYEASLDTLGATWQDFAATTFTFDTCSPVTITLPTEPSATYSSTSTSTTTASATSTQTPSDTPTNTATATLTASTTSTPTPSQTDTPTATASDMPSQTPSNTPTHTPTITLSSTNTPTATASDTPSQTPSNTPTPTPTITPSPTATATNVAYCANVRFYGVWIADIPGVLLYGLNNTSGQPVQMTGFELEWPASNDATPWAALRAELIPTSAVPYLAQSVPPGTLIWSGNDTDSLTLFDPTNPARQEGVWEAGVMLPSGSYAIALIFSQPDVVFSELPNFDYARFDDSHMYVEGCAVLPISPPELHLPTMTPSHTALPTSTPSDTPTQTATASVTPSYTPTATRTASATSTQTPTRTPTSTATVTQTASNTPSPTKTFTPMPTATVAPPTPDTLAIYDTQLQRLYLLDALHSQATPLHTVQLSNPNPIVGVMGDWNGDGLKTPGYYAGGIFYTTNLLTPTQFSDWDGTWFGWTTRPIVAGRFAGSDHDCVGVVDSGYFPPYGTAFALYYTCDFSQINPPKDFQWLSIVLPDNQGFGGTHQFEVGDFDGDGFDSMAVRRGAFIAYTNVSPGAGHAAFAYAQYWGYPDLSSEGEFVGGDWDGDGLDNFGVYYPTSHLFYRRHDLLWNGGAYYTQSLSALNPAAVSVSSWRVR